MQDIIPLTPQQTELLQQLVTDLTAEQLVWLRGYLAGISHSTRLLHPVTVPAAPTLAGNAARLTILHGSQTGHAVELAEAAKRKAEAAGIKAELFAMGDYKAARLKSEKLVMIAVSTQGEGEPPDDARDFYEFLHSHKAPRLHDTRFAVLGLGDSSYEKFCQAGKDFDARLAALGAQRLQPRVDCDVDYHDAAEKWMDETIAQIQAGLGSAGMADVPAADRHIVRIATETAAAAAKSASVYSRTQPFPAEVQECIKLSGRGSSKEVHHLELSLEGSGLSYEPGDSLGVLPRNRADLVDELTAALDLDPAATIATQNDTLLLREALLRAYDITTLSRSFLEKYAALCEAPELKDMLRTGNEGNLRKFAYGRDIIDIVKLFPVRRLKATEFVGTLRGLQPRLYSISSSLRANPDSVHITVGAVRYHSNGRQRHGVASTYLADIVQEGDTLPVYIEANRNFKLPADPATPIIMIGPGTGIAPFRAFVQERQAMEAAGKNWLFFGDRNFRTDFLYQREWQRHVKDGTLHRIDLAFSRDTDDKVYVQHRLLERGKELFAWLQDGAHLYVCGDAENMARDVHAALLAILEKEGGFSSEAAAEYVKQLQRDKRYQRDVY